MASDKSACEFDYPMKRHSRLTENTEILFDGVALAFIACFLFSYFDYRSLFSLTITAGGDTGSHYFTAQYLRDYLLPQGKLSGLVRREIWAVFRFSAILFSASFSGNGRPVMDHAA